MWSPLWIWESDIPDSICDQIIEFSNLTEFQKGMTAIGDSTRNSKLRTISFNFALSIILFFRIIIA